MNKVVFIIDDDQDDTEIMTEAIHSIDPSYSCMSFIYPDEALNYIADLNSPMPHYIFVDMQMPRQTGDKILATLRAQDRLRNVIIALYSSFLNENLRQTLYNLGANFAFEKPVKMTEYQTILTRIFALDPSHLEMRIEKP